MFFKDKQVRKMVLQYLNDLAGIPQSLAEVAEHIEGRLGVPSEARTEIALTYLTEAAYLQRCEVTAADAPMWKITADGMRQAQRQVPKDELDPMIW